MCGVSFMLMIGHYMVLTFCNTTLFIDCNMTNTNVGLLNVSSLLKSEHITTHFNYFKTLYAQKKN